ncbi:MAG: response regulator [Candidatus Firestonebacteria bacterium]|nr:response regulator [Candidatus Firestonebacteria bacterium]
MSGLITRPREGDSFQKLAEAMGEGVLWLRGSSLRWANPAAEMIFGLGPAELTGRQLSELLGLSTAEHLQSRLQSLSSGQTTLPLSEVSFPRAEGEPGTIELSAARLSGCTDEWVLVFRDIHERRKAAEEHKAMELRVQQAQKLESLGVLAGGIAHDFNNLLMTILGNSSLALLDLPSSAAARKSIEQIETAAIRAAGLANQLLTYSGKNRFILQSVRISQLVEEMVQLLQVSISKKVVLQYRLEQDLPPAELEPTQIRQVIMNLVTNASEAIGEHEGLIIVKTGTMEADRDFLDSCYLGDQLLPGPYIFLEVSDNGCGLDPETQAKIFDPFFTTKFAGRGLGLAAVLGIMRSHRGAVQVASLPGQPTRFKIFLPPSRDTSAVGIEPARSGGLVNWRGQGLVLVVDDEEGVRKVVKMILEEYGFSILTADDGWEALEIFKAHTAEITAVILDLTMPHLDGLKTFQELRRLRPDVKVILTSGYSEEEAVSRFVGAGLAGFIQKPFNAVGLLEKMRQILETAT